jgi:tetratricopeptide (TPR) repeat protein
MLILYRILFLSLLGAACFFSVTAVAGVKEDQVKTLLGRVSDGIEARDYIGALKAANEAVAKARALPQPNKKILADALSFLALAQHEIGQAALAKTSYEKAIEALSSAYGPMSLNLAGALNNLGRFRADTGDYNGATQNLVESLRIKRQLPNFSEQILINTLYNLSDVSLWTKQYDAAEKYLNEIVGIFSRIGVKKRVDYLDTMIDLAHVQYARGDDAAGQRYVDQALEAARYPVGRGQLFAEQLNNQAEIFRRLGRYSDAERIYREAFDVLAAPDNLNLADPVPDPRTTEQIKNNLAITYRAMNRLQEAAGLLREVVEFRQAHQYGPQAQATANGLINLANVYLDLDALAYFAEASGLLDKATAILKQQFGSDSPLLYAALQSQAGFLSAKGEYQQASDYLRGALTAVQGISGPESAQTNGVRISLGNTLRLAGHPEEALPILQQAYNIERKSSLAIDQRVGLAALNLGLAYYDIGRFDDALPVLRAARDLVLAEANSNRTALSSDPVRESRRFLQVGQAFLDTVDHLRNGTARPCGRIYPSRG